MWLKTALWIEKKTGIAWNTIYVPKLPLISEKLAFVYSQKTAVENLCRAWHSNKLWVKQLVVAIWTMVNKKPTFEEG